MLIGAKEEIIFVDTMNLDGETNLKPRVIANEMVNNESFMTSLQGTISCDKPNASLEDWDAMIKFDYP